jgi:hypothetical protein
MNPIHGECGKFYYAMKCVNRNCRENLYIMEVYNCTSEDQKRAFLGELVRCPTCTQETIIQDRGMVVVGIR